MATGKPDSVILICTATVAATDAVGSVDQVNITDSPEQGTVTRFVVPSGQTWIFEDIYISAAAGGGTSSPVVRVVANGGQIMGTTPPLLDLLVSNNSRPPYSNTKFGFRPRDTIQMSTITTILNNATADAIAFRVRVKVL